jgi:site-specific recombinase XerD
MHYPMGMRRREIPVVAAELIAAMAAHLEANPPIDCGLNHGRGKKCTGLVFHSDGKPLSRHGWPRLVFQPAIVAAGVRRGTPHDLRHTYASWLVIDGVPLRVVQELLGHGSIRTTERYSHLAPATLDDPRLLASLTGKTAWSRAQMSDEDETLHE